MLNILYINCDRGAGVEFEGNLFMEIMKRIKGIDEIFVSREQNFNIYKDMDYKPYDLIITNDFTFNDVYYEAFRNVNKPLINISFGGRNHNSPFVDLVIDINHLYTLHNIEEYRNYANINFISGNIWCDKKEWHTRLDDILYVGRFNESKIIPEFLDYVDDRIHFYGPINDNDYFNKWKHKIVYHECIDHRELLDIYNEYKTIYLFSITECLSMTIREAILCGTVPIVLDTIGYTTLIEPYIIKVDDISDINTERIFVTKKRMDKDKLYLNNLLSFDKMILDFLTCLRNITLKDLRFDKNHNTPWKYINGGGTAKSIEYKMDTVDWNNVNL
ncbi:glycosyltransferase [Patescibacteria group bacterium]|nr:glycosyltransferase [Patescibacteria group bacterium]